MANLGSGDNGQFTFLDLVSLASFLIGVQNLDLNVSQTDLQEETKRLDSRVDEMVQLALNEIHSHLEIQDKKIDEILRRLEAGKNDSR